MPRTRPRVPRTSSEEASEWRATYEETPYQELPWFSHEPNFQVALAAREGFLPPSGRVLDIGCGAGSNLLFLARQGLTVHGLDLSPGALRAAGDRAEEAKVALSLLQGDAVALPFRDRAMDAALDNGCFHTLPFELREPYSREVARILRPEGKMILGWIGRETTGKEGPPHRPSLREVVEAFEERFIFARTGFRRDERDPNWTSYFAWMIARSEPQPPVR